MFLCFLLFLLFFLFFLFFCLSVSLLSVSALFLSRSLSVLRARQQHPHGSLGARRPLPGQ